MTIRAALLTTDIVLTSALIIATMTSSGKDRLSRILFVGLLTVFAYFHVVAFVYMNIFPDMEIKAYLYGTFRPLGFLIGPLIYFYVKSLTDNKLKFSKSDILHLIPAFICLIEVLPLWFKSIEEKIGLLNSVNMDISNRIRFALMVGLSLVYLLFSLNLLNDFEAKLKQQYAAIEKWMISWLRSCLFSTLIIWFLCLTYSIDGLSSIEEYIISIGFCSSTYILVYAALRRSVFLNVGADEFSLSRALPVPEDIKEITKEEVESRCGLSEDDFNLQLKNIKLVFEQQRLYLKNQLRLRDVADAVGLPEYMTSQILNAGFEMNFFDLVNQYRVEDAKKRLLSPEHKEKQIIEIAYDVGFNSKSAFNASFKKLTGITPTAFRASTAS